MSYTLRNIPGLADGEYGLKLDDGTLVAAHASVTREPVVQLAVCTVKVRAVDATGKPITDAHGKSVETAHTRSVPAQYLETMGGAKVLVAQTLKIVLGEPDAEVEVNDHIRHAVKAASVSSAEFDFGALL